MATFQYNYSVICILKKPTNYGNLILLQKITGNAAFTLGKFTRINLI